MVPSRPPGPRVPTHRLLRLLALDVKARELEAASSGNDREQEHDDRLRAHERPACVGPTLSSRL